MAEIFDIVFEGGGIKGAAFAGALEVLLRRHQTGRLIGTSCGAITATCLAAGYGPTDLRDMVAEQRDGKSAFASFLAPPVAADFPAEQRDRSEAYRLLQAAVTSSVESERVAKTTKKWPLPLQAASKVLLSELNKSLLEALMAHPHFVQFFSLLEVGALYSDRPFLAWLRERLRAKGFDEAITLKAFHAKTGRHLSLAATDTVDKELLILNHRTAPDCPVVAAVRMSMSIPFLWEEVAWRPEWGPYRGRAKAGNFIVDGGVLSNFPLRYLVDAGPAVQEIMGPRPAGPTRNLGLLIDETKPAPGTDPAGEARHMRGQLKIVQRVSRLLEAMLGTWDEEVIRPYKDAVCFIGAKGFGTLEFDMAPERLELLVNSGRCAMTEHLQKLRL
jgi:predicted acylesterase/phospholipase RssA